MKTKILLLLSLTSHLTLVAGGDPESGYVAHEWGTFTSVQGADGIQFEWNPFVTSDLPKFVYDRNNPTADPRRRRLVTYVGKTAMVTLQRMETPVIYFYSSAAMTVDVKVDFPQGLITEWYPQVKQFGPFATTKKEEESLSRQSFLRWDDVEILPMKNSASIDQALPQDSLRSHYYAARETKANPIRVAAESSSGRTTETEKFLFYRGVGQFKAPLTAMLGGDESYVELENTGTEPLTDLFVLSVRQRRGYFVPLDHLASGERLTVKLGQVSHESPLHELQPRISHAMAQRLAQRGLYGPEAEAMVKTWEDSWFGEDGLRVLYILPREWTDRMLPLTLEPKPSELVRVMVGRAELITPSMERELLRQIIRFSESDPAMKGQAVAGTRHLGLGRFAEATARRVLGQKPNREFSQNTWNLLQLASQSAEGTEAIAQK